MKNIDLLIDEFVAKVNTLSQLPLDEEEVPPFLRGSGPDEYGQYLWKIVPMDCSAWVDPFTGKLSKKLPPSYLSLINRYAFPAFELGPIMFYSNTGQEIAWELSNKIFSDEHLSSILQRHGLLQIGNPYFYNYVPICFDGKTGKGNEYPLVQIDHESILCDSKVKVIKEIAPSFESFVESVIHGCFFEVRRLG